MNIKSIILTMLAWFFGILFLIAGLGAISSEGFLTGLVFIIGSTLLLPPIKHILINKVPKLSRGKLTLLGSVIIFGTLMTVSPSEEPVGTNQTTADIDNTSKTVAEPVVETKPEPPPAEEPLPVEAKISAEDSTISNPFDSTNSTPVALMEQPEPEIKPEPVQNSTTSNQDCSGLPRTCGQMSSCAQAQKALQCGNGRLDRDNDGVPCESICPGG
ncbi:excalibur calcium-binding domain-containing protein [Psychrobacter sp. PAMC 21119]|uniref:excalibur calcium-binding domain-containing protein n=1 Tax=Psychrobacter sp. PAMC 21119 TaxID=1112209 RepID=UPI000287EEFD|nr:excalibur calcium-binding domain-containing protein [Psychrobacter sp. PAMC 21119]